MWQFNIVLMLLRHTWWLQTCVFWFEITFTSIPLQLALHCTETAIQQSNLLVVTDRSHHGVTEPLTYIDLLSVQCLTIQSGTAMALPVSVVVEEIVMQLMEEHALITCDKEMGGSVTEWFRLLDLKSGGPWFKSSTLLLSGFVLCSPKFNSSTVSCR